MTRQELTAYMESILPADRESMDAARRRQAELAKPPGSLGVLEDMSVRLAGVLRTTRPEVRRCRVTVLAADNGVVAEGVSCAPQSVTVQQAVNMTRHKTGMSALAAYFGDDVQVVDVGIRTPVPCPQVLDRKVRFSTGDIAVEPAMTEQQALDALAVGLDLARQAKAEGIGAVGVGEMGIGNTTTSAAVLAALTGASVEEVTGRGGGLTDRGFATKKRVLRQALALHRPDAGDPIGVLAAVGGLDLAAMTGLFLGCAHEGLAAAVDGYISIVAALCAVRLCPRVRDYLFLSHASYEIGYRLAARELGLEPCLLLGMRLGEGSGCPLLFRILQGACAVLNHMATFPEAAIEDGYLAPIREGTHSRWTNHENFTSWRQQKRKEHAGPAADPAAGRWRAHDLLGHPGAPGHGGPGHRPPPPGGAGRLGLRDPGAGPCPAGGSGAGAPGGRGAVRQRHGVPGVPDVLRPAAGRRSRRPDGPGAADRQPASPALRVRVRRAVAGRRDL